MVLPVAAIANAALVQAMDSLKDTIRESIVFADNAQKASLALGQTFQKTNETLGPTMEGLRGDMNDRFAAAIGGMEAGLQGNTAGIARLINQQRLTGTQSIKTAKVFAGMEAALGLSREQTNKLAVSLVETGEDWQISTDNLVNSMDALKDSFPAQALAGMGDRTVGAFKTLTAELGPQLKKPLDSVMKMVLDTSFKGMEKLTMLGIGGVREQLSASRSSEESAKILKEAFITASKKFKEIAGGADEAYFLLGAAAEVFGPAAINFTTVADNLGIRMKEEQKEVDLFAQSLSTLRKEILQPFGKAIAENVYPILLELIPFFQGVVINIADGLRVVLNVIGPVFTEVGQWGENLGITFKTLTTLVAWSVHMGIVVPFQQVRILINMFEGGLLTLYGAVLMLAKGVMWAYNEIVSLVPFGSAHSISTAGVDSQLDWVALRLDKAAKNIDDAADIMGSDPLENLTKALADDDPNKLGNRLLGGIIDGMERNFTAATAIRLNTKKTAENTAPEVTKPAFLDETANILGRSIEAILNVGVNTTAEEMLEELRIATEQREAAMRKSIEAQQPTQTTS
jgi:hypothetical protein